ncbi:MAG: hypothetical protein CMJ33_05015 [Phycisphaerae bacterium]|nr:hypothetical protein [Phycisphaerae bacterium]
MTTAEKNSSERSSIDQAAAMTGWTVGLLFLALALVSSQSWTNWFLHPLNTAAGLPKEVLTDGVTMLRLMLPLAGLSWIVWTILLQCTPVPTLHSRRLEWSRGWALAAALLLSVSVLLRLPLLDDGLWYDEIASFWYYGQFGPGPIIGNMFTPANHTLQTLGSWTSMLISGGSLEPEVIRLPALVLGLATLWPLSALARDAFGKMPWIFLTAALILCSPIALLESTEARGYAFMLFFGASGSALLVRYLTCGNIALLPFYAIITTLGIWSHMVTVVVPLAHAVYLLGTMMWGDKADRDARSQALFGLSAIAVSALTTLTVLAPVIPDLLSQSKSFSATRNDQPDLFGQEGLNSLLGLGGAWGILGGIPGLILVCAGCLAAVRDAGVRRPLVVTGLPILIAILLVSGLGTWVYARFLVFGLPFTVLAIAAGIRMVWTRSRTAGTVATVLLLSAWGGDLSNRYQTPRQPVREIMAAIPSDGRDIGFMGITDLGIILSWYVDDPNRIVELAPTEHDEVVASSIGWIVIAYPSRTIPEIVLSELTQEMKPEAEGPPQTIVEGFVIRELEDGWIDGDGSMMLLERVERDL